MKTGSPLGPWAIGWRIIAPVAALAVLTTGQFLKTNDYFPLGSLSQYSTARDLNGQVKTAYLLARFPGSDENVNLSLNLRVVGIERGDVESQLGNIIADPSMLQTIADGYARLHPGEPQPTHLTLCRSITQLKNGVETGEPEHIVLAEWQVR